MPARPSASAAGSKKTKKKSRWTAAQKAEARRADKRTVGGRADKRTVGGRADKRTDGRRGTATPEQTARPAARDTRRDRREHGYRPPRERRDPGYRPMRESREQRYDPVRAGGDDPGRDRRADRGRERGPQGRGRSADRRRDGHRAARDSHDGRPTPREGRAEGGARAMREDRRAPHRPQPEAERLRRRDRPVTAGGSPSAWDPDRALPGGGFAALGVPEPLARRLERDGITEPFPIQAATIPDALAGRDVLARGRTGSGKTLAFGLPLLARLAGGSSAPRRPRALVLVPTRELAMQVSDALQPLVHVLGLRHKLVAGGMPYPPQIDALQRGVDVLIATPGRLRDLVERGAAALEAVETVVLDEADHMAEMGFLDEVTELLDLTPAGGQRMLFSATLDRGVDGLVERYLTDPVVHSTDEVRAAVTTMSHHFLLVEPAHKKPITAEVANREGRTLVFVRTKLGADRVASQLRDAGVFAAALHGGLNQGARNRVLRAFRDGTLPVLVATDVAARGIHVDEVSVVLQVDPPADHKDYLHRAGRTARAGEHGTVVTLALPHQRRPLERLARDAGLDGVVPVPVSVGDHTLLAATGARRPSGVPVPEERLRRILEGGRRHARRPGPRAGSPGGRGGRHGRRPHPGPPVRMSREA